MLSRVGTEGEVQVIGQHRNRMNAHPVLPLSPSNDPHDEVVQGTGWTKQKAAMDGSESNLDHGTLRHEAQRSRHTRLDAFGRRILTDLACDPIESYAKAILRRTWHLLWQRGSQRPVAGSTSTSTTQAE